MKFISIQIFSFPHCCLVDNSSPAFLLQRSYLSVISKFPERSCSLLIRHHTSRVADTYEGSNCTLLVSVHNTASISPSFHCKSANISQMPSRFTYQQKTNMLQTLHIPLCIIHNRSDIYIQYSFNQYNLQEIKSYRSPITKKFCKHENFSTSDQTSFLNNTDL